MKVCQKVRAKGTTTYNEVADELVAELCPPGAAASPDQQYEQKNIRRRVYDALNVLMAMQIISKERKRIQWLGLAAPPAEDSPDLEQEKADCRQRISEKTQQLKDLVLRQIAFKNLVERNKALEETEGPPEAGSSVQLPFLVVNTKKKTVIDCSISSDKREYLFNFNDTFEIHDDIEVLKRMGMTLGLDSGTCGEEDLGKAAAMLPPSLAAFIEQVALEAAGALDGPEPSPDRLDRPLDQLETTWESP
ncbi:transcription factor Dp-2-like [Pollicipes pollicipes]|uniref:transcription factor Dp-2-like n=1 Tax=Pollicipes pollicipes TaxID=41117 RepID=UPI0018859913|nr:transcription factor Dp-2-like [Pollicipes pollicipes]